MSTAVSNRTARATVFPGGAVTTLDRTNPRVVTAANCWMSRDVHRCLIVDRPREESGMTAAMRLFNWRLMLAVPAPPDPREP
jgi:hypothetical protein